MKKKVSFKVKKIKVRRQLPPPPQIHKDKRIAEQWKGVQKEMARVRQWHAGWDWMDQ